jgi:hypothetical protein
MDHRCHDIQGWFDFEGIYSRAVTDAPQYATFVEIGCWLGKSSSYMATDILNSGKYIDFYCVDTWKGSPNENNQRQYVKECGGSLRSAFEDNMRGLSHYSIEETSVEAAKGFADHSLDLVFIDASHDYANVCGDIAAWYPKVRYGGIIAGHDVNSKGLMTAVQERLPATEITIQGSSWLHRNRTFCAFDGVSDCRSRNLLFILFANCPGLVVPTINSVPAGLQAIVVDYGSEHIKPHIPSNIGYLTLDNRPTTAQLHNMMLRRARHFNKTYLLTMRSGASCPRNSLLQLLRLVERQTEKWGVILTSSDALRLFNVPTLLSDVGVWDETFTTHVSDCDYLYRMSLADLGVIRSPISIDVSAGASRQSEHLAETMSVDDSSSLDQYIHKWGGPPRAERFKIPYDGTS